MVLNKIDRQNTTPDKVIDQVLDLFIELGADDNQAEFPIIYASGIKGMAKLTKSALEVLSQNGRLFFLV